MKRASITMMIALIGVALHAPPTSSAPNPDARRILFVRSGDIYSVQPNGFSQRRLTYTFNNGQPEWSPSGTKIAFVSTRDGDQEIFSMNPDGSGVRQLTRNTVLETGPTWSPNGLMIAYERDFLFARYGPGDVWTGTALYVMNASGTGQRNVTPLGVGQGIHEQIHNLVWSPNGQYIAGIGFQWLVTQDSGVYVFDLAGNTVSAQERGGLGVGFAADGDVLGCGYDGTWKWDPTAYYTSGEHLVTTGDFDYCTYPTMSSGMKFVAFAAAGVLRGYALETYTNLPLAVTTGLDPYDWSPSGRLMVAATPDGIRVVAPDNSYTKLLPVSGTDPNW